MPGIRIVENADVKVTFVDQVVTTTEHEGVIVVALCNKQYLPHLDTIHGVDIVDPQSICVESRIAFTPSAAQEIVEALTVFLDRRKVPPRQLHPVAEVKT